MKNTLPEILKRCIRCEEYLHFEKFPLNAKAKDKKQSSCRSCIGKYNKTRLKNESPQKRTERLRQLKIYREKTRGLKRAWYQKNKEKINAARRMSNKVKLSKKKSGAKWNSLNRVKVNTHGKIDYAIQTGRIIRQSCERCDSTIKAHAHHADYKKPLEVVWLCPQCHADEHRMQRAGLN